MTQRTLLLAAVLLLLAGTATAQPTGTWVTSFADNSTAWLVIEPGRLVVVNQNSEGKCMSAEGQVQWDGLTPTNRDWEVARQGDSLAVTFPPTFATDRDTTVRYSRTHEDPIALCKNEQDI